MLNLKPNHKAIRGYYQEVESLRQAGAVHEGATAPAFASLLRHCAGQFPHLRLIEQYPLPRLNRRPLRVDGVIVDSFMLRLGVWEAKDNQDDLQREIPKKFAAGYPKDNILFQSPERLILWQNGRETFDVDMRQPEALIEGLQQFFGYQPPAYAQWQEAVIGFKGKAVSYTHLDVYKRQVQAIRQTLAQTPGVSGVHDVRTRKMGDMIVVDAHLEVLATLSVEQGLSLIHI